MKHTDAVDNIKDTITERQGKHIGLCNTRDRIAQEIRASRLHCVAQINANHTTAAAGNHITETSGPTSDFQHSFSLHVSFRQARFLGESNRRLLRALIVDLSAGVHSPFIAKTGSVGII